MNNEEAADKLQHWIDGDGPMSVDAVEAAIAALRIPPATGAAAMREAAAWKDALDRIVKTLEAYPACVNDCATKIALECTAAIRAIPAPEVPDADYEYGPELAGDV